MPKEDNDIRMIEYDIDAINSEIAEIKVTIANLKYNLKYERPPHGNPDVAYFI